MPFVVRQALAQRLAQLPELRQILADVSRLTGVPVRFTSPLLDFRAEAGSSDGASLCAYLHRSPAGCEMCISFRHKLREASPDETTQDRCDAGLWEVLVPVVVGTQAVGHLVALGMADKPFGPRELNRAKHLLSRYGIDPAVDTLAHLAAKVPVLDGAGRQALGRLLQAVAGQVARGFTEHLVEHQTSVPPLVEQAYRIVHSEFARPLRVPGLAERLGVSSAHLSRTFHRATGLRLVDYISRFRAERARNFLQETDRSIREVAAACGFNSISQFNRVFRATFGQTPSDLRR